ncbi:hypothetical protein ACQY0O_005714 [Thecaphora frezii]
MPDWSSPVTIGQVFSAAQALMYICFGMMLCDTFRYASFDWTILSGQRVRRWPQIPYLFSKACYWSYMVTNLFFVLAIDEFNCNGVLQAVEMQMGWITVSSSLLLACRAVCVYTGRERKVVAVFLGVYAAGMLAAWMVGVPDGVAAWVPNGGNPWQRGACNFVSISPHYAIKYIVTIVYDLLVMLLTVVGVLRMNGNSRIGTLLIQQGIFYFLATFAINAMVTGLTLAQLNPVMSLIGAIPAATVCVMASTRLYVELALEAQPKPGGVSSSYISSASGSGSGAGSGGTGEKIARLFRRHPDRSQGSGTWTQSQLRNTPAGFNVHPIRCDQDDTIEPHETQLKSLHRPSSNDDLEAQSLTAAQPTSPTTTTAKATAAGRGTTTSTRFVALTHSQTVTSEPMPDYLTGPPFLPSHQAEAVDVATSPRCIQTHPYANDVRGHFPRLSKS